ncbi:hypothetical protein BIV57_02125 [Mangrovactinospora gilvigrisea]|uniref:ParB-like N-terminal domain-containing protein n=1 Tax=Mangrovactinospora gilvigrisea TaxID=1428644 RepID=A0A1J7BKM5_9ACTN|nr:hypothetical protein BIV57_02125 [Mangrovactinospora gilvigrisea]
MAPNPRNLRDDFATSLDSDEAFAELTRSVASVGVLHACLVISTPVFLAVYPEHRDALADVPYVLAAGERRRAAAERAGLTALPVELRNTLLEQLDEVMITENLHRRGLNPVQEAIGYQRMIEGGLTVAQTATRIGKGKSHVSKRLALLQLDAELQRHVREGRLGPEAGYLLASKLTAADAGTAWQLMTQQALTVHQAIEQLLNPEPQPAFRDETVEHGPSEIDSAAEGPEPSGPTSLTVFRHKTPRPAAEPFRRETPAPSPTEVPAPRSAPRSEDSEKRTDACRNLALGVELPKPSAALHHLAAAMIRSTPATSLTLAYSWLAPGETAPTAEELLTHAREPFVLRLAYACSLAVEETRAREAGVTRGGDARDAAYLAHLAKEAGYTPSPGGPGSDLALPA